MRVIAILERSAGNETVGEMWRETKSFPPWESLETVLRWANAITRSGGVQDFRGHLELTIDQGSEEE
jgi:hypothetical protein